MSQVKTSRQELFRACRVLFGEDVQVSVGFLNYLQLSGVKAAYRRRALEFHPDRAAALSGDRREMEERFKEVNRAYKQLAAYVESPAKLAALQPRPAGAFWPLGGAQAAARRGRPAGRYYAGELPPVRLPLGRFLYYSGAISYENLVASVAWQRLQHTLLGRVAVKTGFLRDRDLLHIVRHALPFEKFGECAVRQGLLTRPQLDMLLAIQQRQRPQIGRFFHDKGLLTLRDLNEFLVRQYTHNRRHTR